jgi:hypothetical protein
LKDENYLGDRAGEEKEGEGKPHTYYIFRKTAISIPLTLLATDTTGSNNIGKEHLFPHPAELSKRYIQLH